MGIRVSDSGHFIFIRLTLTFLILSYILEFYLTLYMLLMAISGPIIDKLGTAYVYLIMGMVAIFLILSKAKILSKIKG